jgi:hypothetical protein
MYLPPSILIRFFRAPHGAQGRPDFEKAGGCLPRQLHRAKKNVPNDDFSACIKY